MASRPARISARPSWGKSRAAPLLKRQRLVYLPTKSHARCGPRILGACERMDSTDFLLLYQELGLRPGADIDDLKLAYRRRIAALHPDRQPAAGQRNPAIARERLQRLTRLYGAAMVFHRRHGRLPGASTAPHFIPHAPAPHSLAHDAVPRRSRRPLLLALVGAVSLMVAATVLLGLDEAGPGSNEELESSREIGGGRSLASVPAEPAPRLKRGMRVNEVLEIEAEPISRGADRWDYGPSWIAFERGKVVSWYSSPLHPLRNASTRPNQSLSDETAP